MGYRWALGWVWLVGVALVGDGGVWMMGVALSRWGEYMVGIAFRPLKLPPLLLINPLMGTPLWSGHWESFVQVHYEYVTQALDSTKGVLLLVVVVKSTCLH